MNQIFKEEKLVLLVLGLIIFSWFFGQIDFQSALNEASAATSSQVTVSATVLATVSCSSATTTTAFGSVDANAVYVSTPNVTTTMSCANSSLGCTLSVKDAGNGSNPGLYKSTSPTYLITSADATLSAGTDGYGIQGATTTNGSGGVLILNSKYNVTGNTVGGLTLAGLTLASSSATTSNREVVVTHKMAVSATAPSGNYSDTITYSCVAN
ncbi:MAG: hypothetical protein ACP5QN_02540 [Minisyncoccia bacterium]